MVVESEEEEKLASADPDREETEKRKLLARSSVVPFILEATEQK